jgi:hypothetical protein
MLFCFGREFPLRKLREWAAAEAYLGNKATFTDDATKSIGSPPVKLLVSLGLFLPSRTTGTWKAMGQFF